MAVDKPDSEEKRKKNAARWQEYYSLNRSALLASKRRYVETNRERIAARAHEYYLKNQAKLKAYSREYARTHDRTEIMRASKLRAAYGINPAIWKAMYKAQNGQCAICFRTLGPGRQTHVDHDHVTGCIRQLLCKQCNGVLGLVSDQTDVLQRAIEYVEYWRQRHAGEGVA